MSYRRIQNKLFTSWRSGKANPKEKAQETTSNSPIQAVAPSFVHSHALSAFQTVIDHHPEAVTIASEDCPDLHLAHSLNHEVPLLQLPLEIITYLVSFTNSDPATLRNVALACRALREPAQRALFVNQKVKLLSAYELNLESDIVHRFQRFKEFAQFGPRLHHFVRSLHITHEIPASEETIEQEIISILVSFIQESHNLNHLNLKLHHGPNCIPPILQAVQARPRSFISMSLDVRANLAGAPIPVNTMYVSSPTAYFGTIQRGLSLENSIQQSGILLARIRPTITELSVDSTISDGILDAAIQLQFPNLTKFYIDSWESEVDSVSLKRFLWNHSAITMLSIRTSQSALFSADEDASGFLPNLTYYSGSFAAFLSFARGRKVDFLSNTGHDPPIQPQELILISQSATIRKLSLCLIPYTAICNILSVISNNFWALESIYLYVDTEENDNVIQFPELVPPLSPLLSRSLRSLFFNCGITLHKSKPYSTFEYWIEQRDGVLQAIEEAEVEMGLTPTPTTGLRLFRIGSQQECWVKRCWIPESSVLGSNTLVPVWERACE